MELAFNDSLKFFVAVFSILNPLGVIPAFITLTRSFSEKEIQKLSISCSLTVFITIAVSLFFGLTVLEYFGVSLAAFRVGGGILIASNAFIMLKGQTTQTKINQEEMEEHHDATEIGIIPLAIPLLSGPGVISTTILYAENFNSFFHYIGAFLSMGVIAFIVFLIMRSGRYLSRKMGKVGLNVMGRIMGLILLAIAIETISAGIKELFFSNFNFSS